MIRKSIARVFAASFLLGTVARGEVPFTAAPPFATGSEPWGTVIADFDNDGLPDVAMTNFETPGHATVLAGNGHGSFSFRSSPAINKSPQGITAGDFDGDGRMDLVVSSISNDASDIVSVLRGRGDGTFDAAVEYAVGAFPVAVVVNDVNGDGIPDILTENGNSNSISVLLGVGDGTFDPRVDYDLGLSPMNIVMADMDGDGIADVVVSANSFFADFAILAGHGDGTFGAPLFGGSGDALYYGLTVADFNRDGRPDIALLDRPGSSIDLYLAEGGGLFANVATTPTDADVSSIATADLFGDGQVELLTAGGSGVRLFEVGADGSLRDAGAMPGVVGGAAIAIADIDGDGRPDVVAPSYFALQSTALINQTVFRGGFE